MNLKKQKGESTLLIILVILLLIGLLIYATYKPASPAQEIKQSGSFQVEMLFENDGCKMYRFEDAGKYIYYSKCSNDFNGNVSNQTSWNETISCGKGCVKTIPHQVSTKMEDNDFPQNQIPHEVNRK